MRIKAPAGGAAEARGAAAGVLAQVMAEGRSLSAALPPALAGLPAQERALLQELCYGVLRWGPRLEVLLARLMTKPLRDKERVVHALLLVGLYQLFYTRIPPYAAVAGTVDAARALGKPWAAGLVNAVLRGAQKGGEVLLAEVDRDESAAAAHPVWLLESLRAGRPEEWRAIVAANNERAPMSLRVNRRRGDRAAYLARLAAAGIDAAAVPRTECGVVLARPLDVDQLPGFAAGEVSVQDGAAQLAAELLDAQPGERVLDACAAPGGKTCHILERQPALAELTALDHDATRMARVHDNLARLGLTARVIVNDAARPDAWWDGAPFDRIVLDAPCAGLGVIRRHPDIKYLRRPEDIAALAALQGRLLDALWPLLRAGGKLVYVTCSVLPQENEMQIERFLRQRADAREHIIAAAWGRALNHGRLILPGEEGMDGFYYACLEKT